jgi:hypothetical protein
MKGSSAVTSGLQLLALIIALVLGAFVGGFLTFKMGYYAPCMLVSCIIGSIGVGLISTWQVNEPTGSWIGYQAIFGFGLGMGMQLANLGVQTVLAKKDVPIGAFLMFFGLTLGGTLRSSECLHQQSIKKLVTLRRNRRGNGVEHRCDGYLAGCSTGFVGSSAGGVNSALMGAVDVALSLWCTGIIGALGMEWKSVKKDKRGRKANSDGEKDKERNKEQGKIDAKLSEPDKQDPWSLK